MTSPASESLANAADELDVSPENLRGVHIAMRCPVCGQSMAADLPQVECVNGHVVPVREGYVDATGAQDVVSASTAEMFESFGDQWTTFSSVREEDGALTPSTTCVTSTFPAWLAGSASTRGVDVDGTPDSWRHTSDSLWRSTESEAVRSAAQNMRDLTNTVVIRSDLRQAPFADESFGFVAAYGVLHHLEDPRAGFDRLVRLLAPGGILTLYLYSRPDSRGPRGIGLAAAAWLRRYTVGLAHPVRTRRLLPAGGNPVVRCRPAWETRRHRPRRKAVLHCRWVPIATSRCAAWFSTPSTVSARRWSTVSSGPNPPPGSPSRAWWSTPTATSQAGSWSPTDLLVEGARRDERWWA